MNPGLFVLLLCASLVPAMQAKAKTILPDACGDDDVKFKVDTKKDHPAPPPPTAGKAQIALLKTKTVNLILSILRPPVSDWMELGLEPTLATLTSLLMWNLEYITFAGIFKIQQCGSV